MAVAITIALYTSPYGSHDFDQRSSSPSKSGDQFHQSPVSVINGPVTWTTSSSRRFISKGFVTHVFGTCVNSSTSKLSLEEDDDELMFSMDDENESCVKDMLLDAQLKYNVFNDDLVVKAFFEAAKAHKGQMRASGDPYLLHCVETAGLLATIGANAVVVAAGLLHDTIDDSFMSYEYILETFGAGLADLVKGVSRLSELSKLARESNTATKIIEADRMHTMFLYGRHKSLYSVHCKMLRKKLSMGEIHDVHGLRLIVENKEDCYKALKVVHGLWPEVPGKFKDYINQPKCNGYRSLHTVVTGIVGVPNASLVN